MERIGCSSYIPCFLLHKKMLSLRQHLNFYVLLWCCLREKERERQRQRERETERESESERERERERGRGAERNCCESLIYTSIHESWTSGHCDLSEDKKRYCLSLDPGWITVQKEIFKVVSNQLIHFWCQRWIRACLLITSKSTAVIGSLLASSLLPKRRGFIFI